MSRLIDANKLKEFFFSESSGTEEILQDLVMRYSTKTNTGYIYEDDAYDMLVELLEMVTKVIDTEPTVNPSDKDDYFRWHSLAKNENDLPDMGIEVETLVINKNGNTFYDHNWIIPSGEWAKVGNSANTIKWRYIDNE